MLRFRTFYLAGLLALTACSGAKNPNSLNFRKAIDRSLEVHGEACTAIDRQFPIDLPRLMQSEQFGIGPKLASLEQAGLVDSSNTKAVVHSMLDPLRGSGLAQPLKQYDLTEYGKNYFQIIPGSATHARGFCYGQKRVDSIVKWTEPLNAGGFAQTEVTYTYKIDNEATWAERPDVRQAFSDIRSTLDGAAKKTEVIGLVLTNKGWEVPGQ